MSNHNAYFFSYHTFPHMYTAGEFKHNTFSYWTIILKLKQAYMLFSGVTEVDSHIKHPSVWKKECKMQNGK